MRNEFIPVNTPLLNGNELEYVSECINTGWISSEGSFVQRFEEAVALKVNRKFGIAVSSGTAALDIAIAVLNISKGDEVILPSHTIISCITQIIRCGAVPILVDSDPNTWNMNVSLIESKITKKTKAIMAVHLYGLPVDVDPILALAQKYGVYVIEDASQMIGQIYKGRPCGSFGHISTSSFYPNKQITTGEGGICLVNDEELADKCRYYRNLCFQTSRRFVHEDLGWNYRMTNIQAAIGLAQVEKLEFHVEKKREVGNMYLTLLKDVETVQLPLKETLYAENIFWVFGLILKDSVPFNAIKAMEMLAKEGIGTRPFYYPMHLQPVFLKQGLFKNEKYVIAENLAERGFYIPSGIGITEEQVVQTAEKVIKLLS